MIFSIILLLEKKVHFNLTIRYHAEYNPKKEVTHLARAAHG